MKKIPRKTAIRSLDHLKRALNYWSIDDILCCISFLEKRVDNARKRRFYLLHVMNWHVVEVLPSTISSVAKNPMIEERGERESMTGKEMRECFEAFLEVSLTSC